jgi:hypothetical protein
MARARYAPKVTNNNTGDPVCHHCSCSSKKKKLKNKVANPSEK